MLNYIITLSAILLTHISYSQISVYAGFGISGNQLTIDSESTLEESFFNKSNYKFCLGTEYAISNKNYGGIKLSYSKIHTDIRVLSYNEHNNIRSYFFANTPELTQHKLNTTLYLGQFITKNISIEGGISMVNNISNKLTGTKINNGDGAFSTVSYLDDKKYGSSTAFGFQLSANYHIRIDRFSIIPSISYQYESKTGIGANSALKIGNIHYIGELKFAYTLQSKNDEK